MTITLSIDHVPSSSTIELLVPEPLTGTNMSRLAPIINAQGEAEQRYAVIVGDPNAAAVLHYRSGVVERKKQQVRRIGGGLKSTARAANSVSGETLSGEVSINTTINLPMNVTIDTAQLARLYLLHVATFAPIDDLSEAGIAAYFSRLMFGVTELK